MIRRIIKGVCIVASILLSMAYIVSHWHPSHNAEVWDRGAQWFDLKEGAVWWFFEDQRDQFQGTGVYNHKSRWLIPPILELNSDSFGYTSIQGPGVGIHWCHQSSGYRRYEFGLSLFVFACVTSLYPVLSVVIAKIKRSIRRCRGRCVTCSYDLAGNVSGVCPECAAPTTTSRLPDTSSE